MHSDLSRMLQHRGVLLALSRQIDGIIPTTQSQIHAMEEASVSPGGLMMAFRENILCGPAQFVQCMSALFFATGFFKKLVQFKTLLILN
jgi:hypothetical protein